MIDQIHLTDDGPYFSRLISGLWRLADWKLTKKELAAYVDTCLKHGITTFDEADIYGNYTSESIFGEFLKENPGIRKNIQIVTKCGIKLVSENRPEHKMKSYDTSAYHIMTSVDQSLKNLNIDYIDVLLIHRPDPFMDADEVSAAFSKLKHQGKVRHFGVSNFSDAQFRLLESRCNFPLVTNQIELSVLHIDPFLDGTMDFLHRLRISPMAWSPLAGGRLFDKKDENAKNMVAVLEKIGKDRGGLSAEQIALSFLTSHPANILPILGTGKVNRIKSAVEAVENQLTREEWYQIWIAATGKPLP